MIAPMAITKTLDLRFGKFAPGATAGTVIMATAGARSVTGGVVLSALDAGGAASFNVTGDTTANLRVDRRPVQGAEYLQRRNRGD